MTRRAAPDRRGRAGQHGGHRRGPLRPAAGRHPRRNPGSFDLSSLRAITSSGAMWSEEIKVGLLAHHGAMLLVDAFSSSEALGMGVSVSAAGFASHNRRVHPRARRPGPRAGQPRRRAGQRRGRRARPRGRNPSVTTKTPKKAPPTFRVVDGVRYSVPGDFAQIRARSIRRSDPACQGSRGRSLASTRRREGLPREVEEVLQDYVASPTPRSSGCLTSTTASRSSRPSSATTRRLTPPS